MVAPRYILRRFDPLFAAAIASWVRNEEELFLLAPSTPFPLTPSKISAWTRKRGDSFLLFAAGENMPCGYGEINPMRSDPRQQWLGHLLVDPQRRGRGVGRALTAALVERALTELAADRITLVVFPENKPAIRCYERGGFELRGEEHQAFRGEEKRYRLLRFELRVPVSIAAGASLAPISANPAQS